MGRARKFLLGMSTACLLIALTEAGVRFAVPSTRSDDATLVSFVGNDLHGRFPTVPDSNCFWRIPPRALLPDVHPPEVVNSLGFRGPEFAREKPPGGRRLLLLGDSNTFGIGVDGDETFAHYLRRWLSLRTDGTWEVLNCGVPGYSVLQMRQLFATVARAFDPDAVVIYTGAWNDFSPAMGRDDLEVLAALGGAGIRGPAIGLASLALFRFFRAILGPPARATSRFEKGDYQRFWESGHRPDGPRLSETRFRHVLSELCQEVRAAGAKVVVVVPPAPNLTREKWCDSGRYARICREVARLHADAVADARSELVLDAEGDKLAFHDIIHPSPYGHMVIASSLSRALTTAGVPGIPKEPIDFVKDAPVQLKRIQATALHEVGDPLEPADAARAVAVTEEGIALPAPHRVTFRDVLIPRKACLQLDLAFTTRSALAQSAPESDGAEGAVAGPHVFEVRVVRSSGEAFSVFRVERSARSGSLWTPISKHRVDLERFGGERVTLVLECTGAPAEYVFWGRGGIVPFR